MLQHPAAGVSIFIIAPVGRVEFPHPAADGNAEKSCGMDHRLIEKIPFFLLQRVRGKSQKRVFQFLHKMRVIRFCQGNDFLIPEILIDIGGIDLLRGNDTEDTGTWFSGRCPACSSVCL